MQDTTKTSKRKRTVVILLGIGLAAGIMGGLLGIGGGVLIVPALVFFLAFDQHRANGTSLAVVIVLSLVGVLAYLRAGNVDLRFGMGLAAGGIIGAIIGGSVVQKIKNTVLRRAFCVFLILTAVKMIYDSCVTSSLPEVNEHSFTSARLMLALGAGTLTGLLSSLLGVGGGIIMIPMLTMVLHFNQHTAQGTSLGAMIPIALTGMLKHDSLGNVDFRVAYYIGIAAAAGVLFSSWIANSLPCTTLRIVFGVFLAVMAILMALKKK